MKLKPGQLKMVSNSQTLKLCVHFCQIRRMLSDPKLHIYGTQIPLVKEAIFLGLIFDDKLFLFLILKLKAKCLKALDILKVLHHSDWEGDWTVLFKLYRTLTSSKLDYGSIV